MWGFDSLTGSTMFLRGSGGIISKRGVWLYCIRQVGNFERKILCFTFFRVIYQESIISTKKWIGMEVSRELETCLTWRLVAKFSFFLGRAFANVVVLLVFGWCIFIVTSLFNNRFNFQWILPHTLFVCLLEKDLWVEHGRYVFWEWKSFFNGTKKSNIFIYML